MIAIHKHYEERYTAWQTSFMRLLPEIERRLCSTFRNVRRELRDELVQEGVVLCLLSYVRLFKRGRETSVSASSLVWFAALQVRTGRRACSRSNSKEPLSHYAKVRRGISVKRLNVYDADEDDWIDVIVQDRRASVPDQVAARLDVHAWFSTLPGHTRRIARDLALGFSTSEVAQKHRLTAGRVSQMRRSLERSWSDFQHDGAPP